MPTIDDKVVAISFESSKFEQGVEKTLHSLKKLQDALRFPEAGKGLQAVSAHAKEIDLGHIHKGVDEISHKLGALRLIAIAVFADIAKHALAMGQQMIKALTVQPIIQGFHEYETQINAVQTILANTSAAGTKLKDVTKALDELNVYADKTIYNFGEMTRNIGTFTAAGVDLKTSVASIKGIANLAAVSGSNAQQASTAMYQLSQAISSGTVKLMDWNSVVNAGMGGTVFQRALAQTAEHMGTLKKGAVELSGPMKNVRINGESFRNSLSAPPGKEGWLSGKVLTETLKQLSGDMSDAELKAQGYSEAQIKAIQLQAKMAVEAATKVKTFSQLLTTTKEQLGTGWAKTWQIILGDFGEAKVLFTGISNALGGMIGASAEARNKLLSDWKKLGGRKVLISALKEAFQALGAIIKPIGQAFRDIFPATTAKQLYDLTVRFKEFTATLKPSPETIELLRRTFRGLFAILSIGKQIIGGIFTVFGKLFGVIGDGSGGFLEFTARIGDWLVKVDAALKEGGRLNKFFEGLGTALAAPLKFISAVAAAIRDLFSGGVSDQIGEMAGSMNLFQRALEAIGNIAGAVLDQLGQLGEIFRPIVEAYVSALETLGPAMAQAVSNINFEAILQVIRTGLLAGIFLMFKNFLGKGAGIDQLTKGFAGIGGGILKNISGSFAALQGSLTALQQNLKAKTLKEIAIAVALLAASMVALSFVDPKRLNSALGAITIAFGQLLGAMAILGNITKSLGFIKMPVIAATLILLAGAIFVLSASVIALSLLSWEQLAKGLGAVAVLLGGIVLVTGPLSAASFGMLKAGLGIQAIAVALNILALAVLAFGSMSLTTLGKGLASIGVGLFIIATYMKLMPPGPGMILQGIGLMAIAAALNVLALAVRQLGSMNLETLGKGMGAIGLSLLIIAGAMQLMPKNMILTAAGLLLVSIALQGIARAVGTMGGMSLEQLGKGLGGLALSLTILALALMAMQGAIGGAIALGIAAAGVALLVPAIVALGNMKIFDIIKGLIAMAAAFAIIGGAAILLTSAVPAMLGFGAALILIGAGLALAGAGVFLIGLGLSAVAASGSVAVGVLIQALIDLQKALIENAKLFALGILSIVKAFSDVAPQFVDAIVKILESLLDAIIQLVPKLEDLTIVLIQALIRVLDSQQAPIIQAAFDLLLALLTGIRNNIGQVVQVALEIVQQFLLGVARNIGKVIRAGAQVIISFLRGIASYYSMIVSAALSIVVKFLNAIANNLGKIVTAGGRIITSVVSGIAKNIGKLIKAGTDVIVNFITGIGNAGPRIIAAGTNAIIKLINALSQNAVKLANAGMKAVVAFLNGIAQAIETYAPQMRAAGLRIGFAIVDGMTFGLASKGRELLAKADNLKNQVMNKLKVWKSPPEAFTKEIGQALVLGLADGLSDTTKAVDAAAAMSTGVITAVEDIFEITSPSKVMKRIGLQIAAGLAEGIKAGTEEDVKQSFADINALIADEIAKAKQARSEAKATLATEKDKKKEDRNRAAMRAANAAIADQNTKIARLTAGHKEFNKALAAQRNLLVGRVQEYVKLTEKIDKLKAVVQEFRDQYNALPEIQLTGDEGEVLSGAEQLKRYTEELTNQVGAVQKYNETLQKLRGLGLDDTTYRMLLEKGTSGQAFAQALLEGGAGAVTAINTLDTDLGSATDILADNAAIGLYKAGEEAARGLIAGLESEKAALETIMNGLADTMVNRLKKKLKIKSPSEEFAQIGKFSMEGMAKGFEDSSKVMTDAVDVAAKDALTAMEQSMRDISDVVNEQLDANPVITPILDLTQLESEAQRLKEMANVASITAAASYGQASTISTAQTAAEAEKLAAVGGTSVKFEQNNYSPEALSDIEIYRQTRNQLSQLKSALALT